MDRWLSGMADALAYMEAHLTQPTDVAAIARRAYMSPFHFQRVFAALCGMTVGAYVRRRRLTLAGETLATGQVRVIDAALRFGYDSPDSFNRAFRRFHGVTPSEARRGAALRHQPPLKITLTMEGDRMLEYRIEDKPAFTLFGLKRRFHPETSYQEIPQYWLAVMDMVQPPVYGMYGVCVDDGAADGGFDYFIADELEAGQTLPEGCVRLEVPAHTWAVFPCRGQLPQALQEVNTRMWGEWLPASRAWKLAADMNVEAYMPRNAPSGGDYCELWLPVEPAE